MTTNEHIETEIAAEVKEVRKRLEQLVLVYGDPEPFSLLGDADFLLAEVDRLQLEATAKDAQHKHLVEALSIIAGMPCLSDLLGRGPNAFGEEGCMCSSCIAKAALKAEEQPYSRSSA